MIREANCSTQSRNLLSACSAKLPPSTAPPLSAVQPISSASELNHSPALVWRTHRWFCESFWDVELNHLCHSFISSQPILWWQKPAGRKKVSTQIPLTY
jgi:hypothetical protein